MSDAQIGYGATLEFGNGESPEVFTEIAEVTKLGDISFTTASVDVTHLKSANAAREFIAGLIDGGEVPIEGNYLPGDATQDGDTGLLSIFTSRVTRNWKLKIPTGHILAFTGHMATFGFGGLTPEDKLAFSASVKISGLPTLTEV